MEEKRTYISVKDHTVSGETFHLLYNEEFEMLETFPKPSTEKLPEYYQSEDYISHTDSKRNWFEKIYHFIKSIALKRKLKLIDSFVDGEKSLLDVGCGTGDFLLLAKKNNWNVTGIEPDDKAREIANQKTNDVVYNVDQLINFEKNTFDIITLWHVLEHLPALEEQIAVFESLLKPNGTLIIAVPNYKSYDAHYYNKFWAAFDAPRHLWHFSKTSISKLVSKENFKVTKHLPLIFDAFYVALLSEKYKSGFMNPFMALWIGCLSNLKAMSSGEYSSLIYVIKKRVS